MELFLREPGIGDKQEILDMVQEFEICSDEIKFEGISVLKGVTSDSFDDFLRKLEESKHIEDIHPEWANQTTYVLTDETGHIYGMSCMRHSLKGDLINIGGHVGYAIRPSERGKGYGIIQLHLILEKAYEMGIKDVLVTCRDNNIGSKKTMEKCIGRPDTLVDSRYPGIKEYRYWIDCEKELKRGGTL